MASLGRGHACRARSVIEMLKGEYEFFVFTSGESYEYLEPLYSRDPRVHLINIEPPLVFGYTRRGRVSYLRTGRIVARYLRRFPLVIRAVERHIRCDRPALCIADCEPTLPRAARRYRVPLLNFGAHSLFVVNDLSSLPLGMRTYARVIRGYCRVVFGRADRWVVSHFVAYPIREELEGSARVIGSVLRQEVLERTPVDGRFLLAYLRDTSISRSVLEALRGCGRRVKIYGLSASVRIPADNIEYHPLGETFLHDLVRCEAVISTAGNQLIGEAFHLGKPVFGFPEPNHMEQALNAHFLRDSKGGDCVRRSRFTSQAIEAFLARLEVWKGNIEHAPRNGNEEIVNEIRSMMNGRRV